MSIQSYDLAIDQYADFQIAPVYSLVATAGSTPVPVNLAGMTARLMIRVSPTDASPVVSITTTANAQGSIVLQPVIGGVTQTGMIQVNINKATTALMGPPTIAAGTLMAYDLEIDTTLGTTIPFMSGYVRVKPGNTH